MIPDIDATPQRICHGFELQTFKRNKKSFPEGTLRYDLHKKANASLHAGINLREVVKLPHSEDPNDWIAVHGNAFNASTNHFNCKGSWM